MCVLIVLLAGGAEAQRPFALANLGVAATLTTLSGVAAWTRPEECEKIKDLYTGPKDMIEVMWNGAFTYETNETYAFDMWWTHGGTPNAAKYPANPNDGVTELLGMVVPDTCHVQYLHKDAVTPEANFTECHPWYAGSCCHDATVTTPEAINKAYGEGYEWDRCGPLSQSCERWFVQEACMYECEPNAGHYRKYTDEQHDLCESAAKGAVVTLPSGNNYTCTPDPWGPGNAENKWQLWHMPIKASVADHWWRACENDYFIGRDYFELAGDYNAQIEAELAEAERRRQQALEDEKKKMPGWAIGLTVALSCIGFGLVVMVAILITKERQGEPLFHDVHDVPAVQNTKGPGECAVRGGGEEGGGAYVLAGVN